MKRWLLLFVVFLLAGLGIGSMAGKDPGYVLINWTTISLETTLWFFLMALFLLIGLVYMLVRFTLITLGSRAWLKDWRSERSTSAARKQTTRGLLALAQGQWARAERLLTRSAKSTDTPLINYLAAARATYEQGKNDVTDELLYAASKSTPGAELAVGITQAQLLMSRNQNEQALAVLLKLRENHPRHAYVLKLLVKIYQDLEDWVALHDMLPAFRKTGKLSEKRLHQLENKVYVQLIERASTNAPSASRVEVLKDEFRKMPRLSRTRHEVLYAYTSLLHKLGADAEAEIVLRQNLKHAWHDSLITLYGELDIDPETQQAFTSKHLRERPNDPALLLVLARITMKLDEKEKAKEYLDTALAQANMPELHAEMGRLLVSTGDTEKACEHFDAALKGKVAS